MLATFKRLQVRSSRLLAFNTIRMVSNDEVNPVVYNRNPRNLERLRIAYKPAGYHLDKPGREYWHKIQLDHNNRQVKASLVHCSGKTVIIASTNEWAVKKFLYRNTDTAAYKNLGKVFAQRCLESGITEVLCDLDTSSRPKVASFVAELEAGGVTLSEPKRFLPWRPWDKERPEKPWEVTE